MQLARPQVIAAGLLSSICTEVCILAGFLTFGVSNALEDGSTRGAKSARLRLVRTELLREVFASPIVEDAQAQEEQEEEDDEEHNPEHSNTSHAEQLVPVTVVTLAYQHGPRLEAQIGFMKTLSRAPYSSMVKDILFVWNGPKKRLPEVPGARVIATGVNSLNNRWLEPLKQDGEGAILMLDDDIQISWMGLLCLQRVWRAHRDRLVGVFARTIERRDNKRHPEWGHDHIYTTWDIGADSKPYNMLLPRVMMFSRELMSHYKDLPAEILKYVDEQAGHCDDIAFNAIVAKRTRRPVLRVVLPTSSSRPWLATTLETICCR
eukprot:TRINITY_DN23369_c0_g1_i1.p1 TRINITY_DN23369_c0_g1~~TRINITY_DN23369_c0_g1_i1.p1  ORF type:complete len:320 (-),score=60.21 TRINITY_DN23369_c0_g1_i1:247-1206(-)